MAVFLIAACRQPVADAQRGNQVKFPSLSSITRPAKIA
jgi:hypothetical protein